MNGLVLQNLSKSYAGSPALAGIDLAGQSGEFITLLGPSGCGKSTTLMLIAGLDTPDSGAILLDGSDLCQLDVASRNVGLVFQRYALFPHMTVRRNIAFGLTVRGLPSTEVRSRVDEILEVVQLADLAERFPHQVSGGQMQRIALARTLVTRPRLLMLDEPFAALDAELRVQMRDFVRSLQQRLGLTTIFVTHDQAEAIAISDRIAVMQAGRIIQFDTPENIYNDPGSIEVATMVGAANILSSEVVERHGGLAVDLGFVVCPLPEDRFHVGDVVDVMLRPGAIAISSADGRPSHSSIVSSTFLGSAVRYNVSLAGRSIHVDATGPRRLSDGEPVNLVIEPSHVRVFPRHLSTSSAPSRLKSR